MEWRVLVGCFVAKLFQRRGAPPEKERVPGREEGRNERKGVSTSSS